MLDRSRTSPGRVRAQVCVVMAAATLGACSGAGDPPTSPVETATATSAGPGSGSPTAEPIHPGGRVLDERDGVTVSDLRTDGEVRVQVAFENKSHDEMSRPVTKVATIVLRDADGAELDRLEVPSYFEGEVRVGLAPGDRTSKPATFPHATDAPAGAIVVIEEVLTQEK